jgi:hypothetical protein
LDSVPSRDHSRQEISPLLSAALKTDTL